MTSRDACKSEPPAKGRIDVRAGARALQLVHSVVGACPYALLAQALIRWGRLVLGREDARREVKERRLLEGVTMGRNIALVGFFCPIFWVSLFSGANPATLRFNALHSSCVVLVGLVVMVKNLVNIERSRRRRMAATQGS